MRLLPVLGPFFSLLDLATAQAAYTAIPRWAQAVAIVNDALFVYGGKTDQYNTYGYNSAPWNNDLLFLSLSTSFNPSNPPWQYLSGSQNTSVASQGTALAWHSLSAFNSSFLLSFGGNTGPLSSVVLLDNDDSAQLLNVANRNAPTFLAFPNNWAGEPQRRMRHATASRNGLIYIIGGEAADGSGNTFSTHFIFNPSVPSFTQLPSENAPPGIFGHVAVILFDGRLLVFGGISQGALVPFSTIWVLDTTKSTLSWTLASIDGSNLPSPRASFAIVLLDDGRILIQGGTDAAFQTNLADGWILDPSRNPMTWTPVPALSQVGPRRDHFAFNGAGQVVFGFGFGDNAPADAPLQVYNVTASSFQPTFSPMTAPPVQTTLPPDPSQTTTDPPGSSQTSSGRSNPNGPSGSRTSSRTGALPSSTGGPGGGQPRSGSSKSNLAAIVIGSVFGALGFAALIGLIVWYFRRRRAHLGHAFNPLNDDDEEHHSITAIRIGSTYQRGPRILTVPLGILGMLGLARPRRYMDNSRRDILADEDRSFDWVRVSREGSGGRTSSGEPSTRDNSLRGLSNVITERFASIRNLARGTGSAPHSRVPSSVVDWEKLGGDPFSPEVALMADGLARDELPQRTQDGSTLSGPSRPYVDPFSERDPSFEVLHDYNSESEPESNHPPPPEPERKEHRLAEGRPPPLRTALPPSADFVPLSPVVEQASQASLSNSSHSHHSNSDKNASSGSSRDATTLSPRPSSILDPNPPPSEPMRRSNSWWARFTKTPLLERRGTQSSTRTPAGFIDIRDPNPPPRLLTIEESAHSQQPSETHGEATQSPRPSHAGSRGYSGTPSRRPTLYRETLHGRSATSLQTANTEMLERVGGTMEVVQRDATLDSQNTPMTGGISLDDDFGGAGAGVGTGGTQQLRILFVRGASAHSTRTESSSVSINSAMMLSPLASGANTPMSDFPETASPPTPIDVAERMGMDLAAEREDLHGEPLQSPVSPISPISPGSPGVLERVRAFERRMSRESLPPPPPTNTRQREERSTPPVTARPSVRYGLVPRPSLFVANPDRSGSASGTRGSDGG